MDDAAFSNNPYIKAIILPKNYKNPDHVTPFVNCQNLESLVILNKDIDPYISTRSCPSFCKVYADVNYTGHVGKVKLVSIKEFGADYFTSMKEMNKFYKEGLEK